jgi:hypothetical protein
MKELKPSDFCIHPWDCVFQKSECETLALNIMIILKRTGDSFREFTWEEYKEERAKDGNFSYSEKEYFDQVIRYCSSAEEARKFSDDWSGKPIKKYDLATNSYYYEGEKQNE